MVGFGNVQDPIVIVAILFGSVGFVDGGGRIAVVAQNRFQVKASAFVCLILVDLEKMKHSQ